MRRATSPHTGRCQQSRISIHALLAESDDDLTELRQISVISIHALLAESDLAPFLKVTISFSISIHALLAESDPPLHSIIARAEISIHALLAESDLKTLRSALTTILFLSTLSLRRATALRTACLSSHAFLSTLSLRRATGEHLMVQPVADISIHALLAESDVSGLPCVPSSQISIHALLAESDAFLYGSEIHSLYFYPRSPCGERLYIYWRQAVRP